ncbi:hypothetical protein PFISCL1PPCAC_10519, partial [Pristionchus fissidentatus]
MEREDSRCSTPEDEKTYGIDDPPPADLGIGGGPPPSWRPLFQAQVRQQSDTTGDRRRLTRENAVDDGDLHFYDDRRRAMHRSTFNMSADHGLEEKYIELQKYRLMEEIGQGSYGVVKLAFSEEDNRLYALKVLDKLKLIKNMAFFRRPPPRKGKKQPSWIDPLHMIYKEIAILKKLEHPNVVKLCDVLDEPNQNYLYLVFEYLEKGSVMEVLPSPPMEEVEAWKFFREAFMGLEYLHHQKIIHRDIKPGNLLIGNDNSVKIADFGVSCEFAGIDAFLTSTAGTPAFMAPETLYVHERPTPAIDKEMYRRLQIRLPDDQQAKVITGMPLPCFSGKSQDIWSLGASLYAFVYGEAPLWDPYVQGLHAKIKFSKIKYPEKCKAQAEVSEDCIRFMKRLMIRDSDARHELDEVEDDPWLNGDGRYPLSMDVKNIPIIRVTKQEIASSIRVFTSLGTLILIKNMVHRRRLLRTKESNENDDEQEFDGNGRLRFKRRDGVVRRKSSSVRDPTYIPPDDESRKEKSNSLKPDRPTELTLNNLSLYTRRSSTSSI